MPTTSEQATIEHQQLASVVPLVASDTLHWSHLSILLGSRFLVSTAGRMIYPMLAAIAVNFSVDVAQVGMLFTIYLAMGLCSPASGYLAHKIGQVRVIQIGTLLLVIGSVVCAVSHCLAVFAVGLALIGVAEAFLVPIAQSYISDRTAYARRARALGAYELCWSVSAIVGVTGLVSIMVATRSLAAPYWVLATAGAFVVLANMSLPDGKQEHNFARRGSSFRWMLTRVDIRSMLVFSALVSISYETILVAWPVWLKSSCAANTEQLAIAFGFLGAAELTGSFLGTMVVDRLGKRLSMLIGFAMVAIAQAALPLSGGLWTLAILLSMVYVLVNELTFVAMISFISNMFKSASSKMLSASIASMWVGRALGAFLAIPMLERCGFITNGFVAGALTVMGVLLLIRFTHEETS